MARFTNLNLVYMREHGLSLCAMLEVIEREAVLHAADMDEVRFGTGTPPDHARRHAPRRPLEDSRYVRIVR